MPENTKTKSPARSPLGERLSRIANKWPLANALALAGWKDNGYLAINGGERQSCRNWQQRV